MVLPRWSNDQDDADRFHRGSGEPMQVEEALVFTLRWLLLHFFDGVDAVIEAHEAHQVP